MHYSKIMLFVLLAILLTPELKGQACNGGAVRTHDSYLYGRFEVAMQSAPGDGIVSSFFLYNVESDCVWPQENSEIDIEMTGNTQQVYFTTHFPNPTFPTSVGSNQTFSFNPHDTIMNYAFEWEPGIIRWFVGSQMVYSQNFTAITDLQYPMAILMNLWASSATGWVGVWDPAVMPQQSKYDYVKYYSFTPGNGTHGSNSNYTFEWEDNFNTLDTSRWEVRDFYGFGNNYCTFRAPNVAVDSGLLKLTIDEPDTLVPDVPVTFSVNMSAYNLQPNDIVYLNGNFNGWCGNCEPMTQNNNIWSVTTSLSPGRYEYLFTINSWQTIGNAPIGSYCDYNPCDQYANYGVLVPEMNGTLTLDTLCWTECIDCNSTSTYEIEDIPTRKVVKIYDLLGREVPEQPNMVLIYLYDDGTAEKKVILR